MTEDTAKQALTCMMNTIELLHDAVVLTYEHILALETKIHRLEKFEAEVRRSERIREESAW